MKEEIAKMIWKKMDELRTSIHFSGYGGFTNSSSLERIGEKFGIRKVEEILNDDELREIALTSHQIIPEFLIDFISLIETDLKPKSILDPWITKESYAFQNNTNSFGYCINQGDYKLLTKVFQIDESRIKLGENVTLLKDEKEKFDLIVSFPPFGLRSKSFNNSISKDFATDLLIESSLKLEKNGVLGFLMSSKFAFDKRIKNALKSNGIYINGLFYLPEGSHRPIAGVNSCFVIASKLVQNKHSFLSYQKTTISIKLFLITTKRISTEKHFN